MKKVKSNKEWHTSNSPKGMGDYRGTGVKNPMGKNYETTLDYKSMSPKSIKKPPKSLA